NGVARVAALYSWRAHVDAYLRHLQALSGKYTPLAAEPLAGVARHRDRMLVTDLDQSLIGDDAALSGLLRDLRAHRKQVAFAIATGRRIDSALALAKRHALPSPDIFITSLGTRIQYGQELTEDDLWSEHIDHEWSRRRV